MPRLALILATFMVFGAPATAQDPHMDPSHLPGGCPSCHAGHGAPGSPMLPTAQRDVCLACHGTQAQADTQIRNGRMAATSRPALIGNNMAQAYTHPAGNDAFSASESGTVACTSCHSPHRGASGRLVGAAKAAGKRVSSRDPGMLEFEMCQSCHGNQGVVTQDRKDLSRLMNPNSRSYHPVEGPAISPSPSLRDGLTGTEINCTDCHGNSNPDGPRGVHGSGVRHLLAREYATTDGIAESEERYALCYDCHERERVLDSERFPEHRGHVVDTMASCATCHDPHGAVDNRALIRIAEDTTMSGITESVSAGILAFESSIPGSGSCFLTCHGFDHAPATYGNAQPSIEGVKRDDPRRRRQGRVRGDRPLRRERR